MLRKTLKKAYIALALLLAAALLPLPAFAEDEKTPAEKLADIQFRILAEKIGKYGMTPVYGKDVEDGLHEIKVDSSSAFFRVRKGIIDVKEDKIKASITISSTSYLYVFLGTAAEAEKAPESEWIAPEVVDGKSVFTFDIDSLNSAVDCAAYSKARNRWYDRKLLFNASTLKEGVLKIELPDYRLIEAALSAYQLDGSEDIQPEGRRRGSADAPEAVSVDLPDGEYSIEVNMTGGSGRASVSSPTLLTVRDGKAYASLLWSSANYDYMLLDDAAFYNLTTDGGNSRFEIPITQLDEPIFVIADTTAMGDPLEIEYTLTFYEDTVGTKGKIPQEAAKLVLVIALAIIVFGGALNYFVKKKRS